MRKGVAAAGVILALLFSAFALWSRIGEPVVPTFNPVSRLENVDVALDKLTPAQAFQMWIDLYRPLGERGFANIEDPRKPMIELDIAKRRFFQKMLLAAAGVCILVAVAAAVWPRSAIA